MKDLRVSDFPLSARLLASAVLVFFTGAHVFALWLSRNVGEAAGSAQAHFAYKELIYLLRMSHQHLFGHGTMYFLTGALFLLTDAREKIKIVLPLLPFMGAALDLASWWMLKYGTYDCEWLSILGGTLFTGSFLAMVLVLLRDLWKPRAKQG